MAVPCRALFAASLAFFALLGLGTAQPSLVSFSMVLTPPETLSLTFDTSLPDQSCDVSKLTLQNSSMLITGGSYQPQEGNCSYDGVFTTTLIVDLSTSDWAAIQANIHLATEVANTFLSMKTGFITQGSNSPISSITAIQVTASLFSANINPPRVEDAQLDLDSGILTLSLYEGSQYFASGPILFSDMMGVGGVISLTNYTTPNNVDFFYTLPAFLTNSLKRASPPFTVSLPAGLFIDGSDTTSPAQNDMSVVLVPDSTPPSIISFSLDLDEASLVLTFNEPISPGTVNVTTGFFLSGSFQGSNGSISVIADSVMVDNQDTELVIIITDNALNQVKFDTEICTTAANCLLGVNSSSLSDTTGNVIATSISNIAANILTPDTTRPQLTSFIVDLQSSSVTLTFNEPIDNTSVNTFDLVFDVDQNQSVSLGGASSLSVPNTLNTELLLNLDTSSLIGLKILVSMANITLSVAETAVVDTSSNVVLPILPSASYPPSQIILDQSPPLLINFIAGIPNSQMLTFVFSEPVDLSSWNISALTLTLQTSVSTSNYTFNEGSIAADETLNIITFTIPDGEFNLLQQYEEAYVGGQLEITTRGFLIEDLFGNRLEPITQPIIFNATEAGMRPTLQTVDFDLDSGVLYMSFSDLIVVSYSAGKVHFQDDSVSPSHVFTLSNNGSFSNTTSLSMDVSFTLTDQDINSLKLSPYLGSSSANTFVLLSEDFAYGPGFLPIQIHNGTKVSMFTPDTTNPMITRFELDLDSDTLLIIFNEPVVTDTFDESRIVLLNSSNFTTAEHVFLSSTYSLVQGNVTLLRALILSDDIISIKSKPLCYSIANCYVRLDDALVADVSGNVFMDTEGYSQVDLVSPDVSPPQLVSFPVFDLDSGHFTLVFSEPVNGSSTDYTLVEFHNSPDDSNISISLTEGYTSEDHISIEFFLSVDDLNELKNRLNLCTQREDCWIRLPSFFLTDIGMNPFIHSNYESDVVASFHQPLVFVTDQTAPVLLNATMDLNQGILSLSFSEVIVSATFSPSDVTLQQRPSSTLSLTLSPASIFSLGPDNALVSVTMTVDDLNWVKRSDLFTLSSNSYISFATNLVDVSGNQFQNISRNVGFRVSEIIPDITGPRLVTFNYFDLENNSFSVSFDEPVNVNSLNPTELSLVSSTEEDSSVYSLTGTSSVSATDVTLLHLAITLTAFDRVQIKLSSSLATQRSNTYISLAEEAIHDTSDNPNSPVPTSEAVLLGTGGYRGDASPAALVGFSLDLDSSLLKLTFNDVISSTSIDMTSLTIQNSLSSPTSSVRLSISSIVLSGNNDQINIQLSGEDVFKLKLDLYLATSSDNTFVSILTSFAMDIEGRPVIAIPTTLALPITSPSSFIPDTSPPTLIAFSLDMNTGILTLNFSEPILISTVDPSQLTLHGERAAGGSSITLSPDTTILATMEALVNIDLQLTQSDTDYIKTASDLGIDAETTYISFSSSLVIDVSNNSISSVSQDESIQATDYVIDSTSPELIGFQAHLSPIERLSLTFSESILIEGELATSVTLLSSRNDADVVIFLDEEEQTNQTGLNTVDILLSRLVISRLLTDSIASSVNALYLSISEGQVTDTIGNPVIPVTAFQVQKIYRACFSNTYNNATLGTCLDCSSLCGGSCSGPGTTIGPGGCDSCSVLLLDQQGNQLNCSDTAVCPLRFFSILLSSLSTSLPSSITDDNTLLCQQCDSLCTQCDGPTIDDCFTCKYAFITNDTTAQDMCLESCEGHASSDCITCHQQCCGCTGPTDRDCVACKEDSITTSSGEIKCIPSCQGNTFLSQNYTCEQCNSECVGCMTSNSNTDCTICKNVNLTANGMCMCLAECPPDYYESEGYCLHCHEYCIGCTGPSSRNCTECVEDEVDVGNGEKECVPFCSFGREYDITEESCVLTSLVINLSIAGGAVGGVIILIPVFSVVALFFIRHKKRQDRKGVFFISANYDSQGQELGSLRDGQ